MKATITQPVYFTMTIDTEEEWDWSKGFPVAPFSTRNVGQLYEFQGFCNDLGIKPTYLITHTIASDPETVRVLKKPMELGHCEIGAHLHPWSTPPIEEKISEQYSRTINLPLDLVRRKLINLTQKIEKGFGKRPISFRSGRWGSDGRLLKLLVELGYRIDTSVRPFFSDSCFSYDGASEQPYWPDFGDINKAGNQQDILELPASSGFNRANFKTASKIHNFLSKPIFSYLHPIGVLWHSGLLRKLYICPENYTLTEMTDCAETYLKKGNNYFNMHFHSSSLLPGSTPYVQSEEDKKEFLDRIKGFILFLRSKCNIVPCTLSDVYLRRTKG